MIVDALRSLAVPVDNLVNDPSNARRGDVAAVRRSLTVFGQRKPIVARITGADDQGRPTGIVTAGNHTLMAAVELGWPEIAVVFVSDDATMASAYALADNRTGELASWNYEQLTATVGELDAAGFDVTALGWGEQELEAFMRAEWVPETVAGNLSEHVRPERHTIVLDADGWPIVERALNLARDQVGDPGLTDAAALLHVCREVAP